MLVLSRKEGQRIFIGSSIEIVVTEVSGNRVKLGISAPAEVPINREEVLSKVLRGHGAIRHDGLQRWVIRL